MAERSPIFRLKDSNSDGAEALARIVASGGESTSVTINMSTRADEDGVQTTATTLIKTQADGATIWATGDTAATGEAASTSLQGTVSLDEDGVVVAVDAKAAAEDEGAVVSANTDAGVDPEWVVVAFEQERFETNGDKPTAVSRTYLAAERDSVAELEAQTQPGSGTLTAAADLDLLL